MTRTAGCAPRGAFLGKEARTNLPIPASKTKGQNLKTWPSFFRSLNVGDF